MKLGILVNTDRHLSHLVGITNAALARGHEVIIFTMDDGTKLLSSPEYRSLCKIRGVAINYCDYSAKHAGIVTGGFPEEIASGSQYHNAVMTHDSDRLIVL
ncbi:MAG: hypothetical protein HZA17_00560 [Nitrospirae bacterium]|nr:hypothetical protein [Nitrospirota bacterium]